MIDQMPANDHIAAIIPCYTAQGDTTTLITTTGNQQITNTRIRTVLNRLARSSATDLIALKQKSTCATDHPLLQPLPLAPGLVLCPIKLRTPKVSGDTSTGYINFHAVISVTSSHNKPYQSVIKLTGGTELFALWKASTVKRHFQDARLALSYTAHSPEMSPELALISQKLMEAIYGLLSAQSLHQSATHNFSTILP